MYLKPPVIDQKKYRGFFYSEFLLWLSEALNHIDHILECIAYVYMYYGLFCLGTGKLWIHLLH